MYNVDAIVLLQNKFVYLWCPIIHLFLMGLSKCTTYDNFFIVILKFVFDIKA